MKTRTRARPAREPTTLPAMTPVGVVSSFELPAAAVPLPAALEVVGPATAVVPTKPSELLDSVVDEEWLLEDE